MKFLIGLIIVLFVILIAVMAYIAVVGAPPPCEFGPCLRPGILQK
jgi:hypothetical protein